MESVWGVGLGELSQCIIRTCGDGEKTVEHVRAKVLKDWCVHISCAAGNAYKKLPVPMKALCTLCMLCMLCMLCKASFRRLLKTSKRFSENI